MKDGLRYVSTVYGGLYVMTLYQGLMLESSVGILDLVIDVSLSLSLLFFPPFFSLLLSSPSLSLSCTHTHTHLILILLIVKLFHAGIMFKWNCCLKNIERPHFA